MKRKARMGRPPKPPDERQAERIMVNVTRAERVQLEREARKAGLSLSALLIRPWREKREG